LPYELQRDWDYVVEKHGVEAVPDFILEPGYGRRKSLQQIVREFEERTNYEVQIRMVDLGGGTPNFNAVTQTIGFGAEPGRQQIHIILSASLSAEYAAIVVEKELRQVESGRKEISSAEDILNLVNSLVDTPERPELALCTFVIPERELPEGILVKSA